MSLSNLAALRFFNVAAQTQSFVKAAELLNVTHGAVSRQVRLLEDSLGLELFERRNRAIFLNAAGHTLFQVTAPLFEQLHSTLEHLKQQVREEVLVVSCEPTLAMKWLIARLPDFHRQHPNLKVQLLTAGGPIDFVRSGVDLAIRRDDFHWDASVHSVRVCEEWVGPVCRPALAADTLDGQTLLHSQTRPRAWEAWLRLQQQAPRGLQRVEYEHFYLSIQAASAGQGVALASWLMVQDELASGQLVAPFGFVRDGSGYCLLAPRPFEEQRKCQQFQHWLVAQATECQGPAQLYRQASGAL